MATARALLEAHHRAMNAHDIGQAADAFAPDVVSDLPGARGMRGIEEFRAFGEAFLAAFPDARIDVTHVHEAGDTVIAEGSFRGTHTAPLRGSQGEIPATGRRIDLHFADVAHEREGKIDRHAVYFDQFELMTQLGLMPEPTGSAPA